MAKIVFSFAGTDDPGVVSAAQNERILAFSDDVIRIHLAGCQHRKVGGGTKSFTVFPDLNIVANNIASAFSSDNTLDIDKLQQTLGGAITRIEGPVPGCCALLMNELPKEDLSNIPLGSFDSGYIRVKTNDSEINELYYVDKTTQKLTKLQLDAPKLAIYDEKILGITPENQATSAIIKAKMLLKADFKEITTLTGHTRENILREPIPIDNICLTGFSRGAVTTFATAQALHKHNIKIPVDIIANQPVPGEIRGEMGLNLKYGDLSSCTNINSATLLYATHNLENGWLHNTFFQQMVPKLPATTKANYWSLPYQHHTQWFNSALVQMHINRQLTALGYTKGSYSEEQLKEQYTDEDQLYFTPKEFSQKIFGESSLITQEPIYLSLIKDKARQVLMDLGDLALQNHELNDEQAGAIMAISHTAIDPDKKAVLYRFSLDTTEDSKTFNQIANQVHSMNKYVYHTIHPINTNSTPELREKQKEPFRQYQETVLLESHAYLSKPNSNENDQNQLKVAMEQAATKFRSHFNNQERGFLHRVLNFMSRFIFSTIHQYKLSKIIKSEVETQVETLIQVKNQQLEKSTHAATPENATFKQMKAALTELKEQAKRKEAQPDSPSLKEEEEAPHSVRMKT